MSTYTLTGDDVVILNDLPLNDFPDGDIATLDLPNNLMEISTGKDGNTIFALDEAGNNATLTVRVLMSSNDDKRLNGLIPPSDGFARYVLLTGSVVKQVGNGAGDVSYNTYLLSGGMVQKKPAIKANVNGDTQQAVVEYTIQFANAARAIA